MQPEQFREDFATLTELLRERGIHPVVAKRLPLSDARTRCWRARPLRHLDADAPGNKGTELEVSRSRPRTTYGCQSINSDSPAAFTTVTFI
jgi:hypothetical protein